MTNIDKYTKLWGIAYNGEEVASVTFTEDPDEVTLIFPDGSKGHIYWNYNSNNWEWHETLNTCAGDVGARK